MRAQVTRSVLWSGMLVLAFGLGTAVGQQSPPRDSKGMTVTKTTTLDLKP